MLLDTWVVKYRLAEGSEEAALGAVIDDGGRVQPLCTWEADLRTFVQDEEVGALEIQDLSILEVVEDVDIGFRQLPRLINPHGEHSEPTYTVGDEEDIGDVEVVVRPDRGPGDI